MRPIDADEFVEIVHYTFSKPPFSRKTVLNMIKMTRTLDVVPVRHGKWISVPHKKSRICSECESDEPYKFADEDANVFDYCPHCGAKMDLK